MEYLLAGVVIGLLVGYELGSNRNWLSVYERGKNDGILIGYAKGIDVMVRKYELVDEALLPTEEQ